jgi:hypothetical protein
MKKKRKRDIEINKPHNEIKKHTTCRDFLLLIELSIWQILLALIRFRHGEVIHVVRHRLSQNSVSCHSRV